MRYFWLLGKESRVTYRIDRRWRRSVDAHSGTVRLVGLSDTDVDYDRPWRNACCFGRRAAPVSIFLEY